MNKVFFKLYLSQSKALNDHKRVFLYRMRFHKTGEVFKITGTNLGVNGTVTLGGVNVITTSWSETLIEGTTPSLLPGNHRVVVNVEGQSCPVIATLANFVYI